MLTPLTIDIVCRFVFDLCILMLWGASAYLLVLTPAGLAATIWSKLRLFRLVAIAGASASSVVIPFVRTAMIGNGWADAFKGGMIRDVLLDTSIGTAWFLQAASVTLLLAIVAVRKDGMFGVALACALGLASQALTGHAAMDTGWTSLAHQANDIVHMVAAGSWIGSLLPVLLIVPELKKPEAGPAARTALMRFSAAGHAAVFLVLVSGLVNTILILGSLPTDWSFAYQRLLTFKITLVVLMAMVAIVNRYVLVPRLGRSECALSLLKLSILGEIIASVLIVALVAWLGMLEPSAG